MILKMTILNLMNWVPFRGPGSILVKSHCDGKARKEMMLSVAYGASSCRVVGRLSVMIVSADVSDKDHSMLINASLSLMSSISNVVEESGGSAKFAHGLKCCSRQWLMAVRGDRRHSILLAAQSKSS